jgi:UDP-N-acetyl-2-amino-2-deoxyglucuronate dehydrogenase
MTALIRLAVVGAGIIGKHHAKAAIAHGAFEVVAFIDSDPSANEAAADLAVSLGAQRPLLASTISEAAEQTSIDLYAICTPSGLHVALAEETLALGADVVIEKPLDTTMERASRIASLATAAVARGQLVSVISQHRVDPASLLVTETARSGGFGTITSGIASVAWYRSQEYYDSAGWRGTWALDGGGAVINQGVHTVDLLVWTMGEPVSITADTALLGHERIEVEDVAVATVRFASGALGLIHCTTAAYPGVSARYSIFGTRGSAVVDEDRLAYFHAAGAGSPLASASTTSGTAAAEGLGDQLPTLVAAGNIPTEHTILGPAEKDHFLAGHIRQYDDLATAIRNRTAPAVTVDDALLSLAVVRGLYVSATLGETVLIADVLGGRYDDVTTRVGSPDREVR